MFIDSFPTRVNGSQFRTKPTFYASYLALNSSLYEIRRFKEIKVWLHHFLSGELRVIQLNSFNHIGDIPPGGCLSKSTGMKKLPITYNIYNMTDWILEILVILYISNSTVCTCCGTK